MLKFYISLGQGRDAMSATLPETDRVYSAPVESHTIYSQQMRKHLQGDQLLKGLLQQLTAL